jgi:cell division septum initiation protein DivIVA
VSGDGSVQFNIVRNGYDQEQVQGYIQKIAGAYSELYAGNEEKERRIAELESGRNLPERQTQQRETEYPKTSPQTLTATPEQIARALIEAEIVAEQIKERARISAQIEAEKIIAAAHSEVDRLIRMKDEVSRTMQDMRRIVGESSKYI